MNSSSEKNTPHLAAYRAYASAKIRTERVWVDPTLGCVMAAFLPDHGIGGPRARVEKADGSGEYVELSHADIKIARIHHRQFLLAARVAKLSTYSSIWMPAAKERHAIPGLVRARDDENDFDREGHEIFQLLVVPMSDVDRLDQIREIYERTLFLAKLMVGVEAPFPRKLYVWPWGVLEHEKEGQHAAKRMELENLATLLVTMGDVEYLACRFADPDEFTRWQQIHDFLERLDRQCLLGHLGLSRLDGRPEVDFVTVDEDIKITRGAQHDSAHRIAMVVFVRAGATRVNAIEEARAAAIAANPHQDCEELLRTLRSLPREEAEAKLPALRDKGGKS